MQLSRFAARWHLPSLPGKKTKRREDVAEERRKSQQMTKKKREDFLNSNFTHTIFLIHYWIQMIFFSIPQIMKHLSFLFVLENTQFLQNQIQLSIKKKHIFVAKIYAFNLFFLILLFQCGPFYFLSAIQSGNRAAQA